MRTGLTALTLLAAAGLPLASPPALAAEPTPGRTAVVTAVHISCAGDTVSGTATVRAGVRARPVSVELLARDANGAFAPTGRTATFTATPGRSGYSYSFNVAGMPATTTKFRAAVTAAGVTVRSNTLPVSSCAPGTQVPEAPVALLVPLTLAATAAAVLAVRTRRSDGPVAA